MKNGFRTFITEISTKRPKSMQFLVLKNMKNLPQEQIVKNISVLELP